MFQKSPLDRARLKLVERLFDADGLGGRGPQRLNGTHGLPAGRKAELQWHKRRHAPWDRHPEECVVAFEQGATLAERPPSSQITRVSAIEVTALPCASRENQPEPFGSAARFRPTTCGCRKPLANAARRRIGRARRARHRPQIMNSHALPPPANCAPSARGAAPSQQVRERLCSHPPPRRCGHPTAHRRLTANRALAHVRRASSKCEGGLTPLCPAEPAAAAPMRPQQPRLQRSLALPDTLRGTPRSRASRPT